MKKNYKKILVLIALFLFGFGATGALAQESGSGTAVCESWDLGSELTIRSAASGPIRLTLEQKAGYYAGEVIITGEAHIGNGSRVVSAGFKGSWFKGNRIYVKIDWPPPSGLSRPDVYYATVQRSGKLEGESYNKAFNETHPPVRYKWASQEVLTCKPPPPAPPKPPFIYAGQPIIPPNMPFGIVPLSWDGGPDHPNVEVWLSMDNGAEIPAFSIEQGPQSPVWKQPKISMAVQLQRYHHYRFVLKDAGKTLFTAAGVVVP